jgi:hypothetical protein
MRPRGRKKAIFAQKSSRIYTKVSANSLGIYKSQCDNLAQDRFCLHTFKSDIPADARSSNTAAKVSDIEQVLSLTEEISLMPGWR